MRLLMVLRQLLRAFQSSDRKAPVVKHEEVSGDSSKLRETRDISRSLKSINDISQPEQQTEKSSFPETESLAFLGDAVMHMLIRSYLVNLSVPQNQLHNKATSYVRASAQSRMLYSIMDILTNQEKQLIRRARNRSGRGPRHGNAAEYRMATALEALLGYLTVKKDYDRIEVIWKAAMFNEEKQTQR